MSDRVRASAIAAAEAAGVESMDRHSGAAHDTMHGVTVTDAGMLGRPPVTGFPQPAGVDGTGGLRGCGGLVAGTLADLAGAT